MTLPTNVAAVTVLLNVALVPVKFPPTERAALILVLPVCVIFPETIAPFKTIKSSAVTVPLDVTSPTAKDVNVPTDVIFG